MLASLNHQNDISQSEQQIHVGSHVEYPISFGRVGNNLPKGKGSVFLQNKCASISLYVYTLYHLV
jgi:hypothetical protein